MVNVVPFSCLETNEIVPLCDSIIFFTIPNPKPIPEFFVVNFGSKILSVKLGEIPFPLSDIIRSVSPDSLIS